MTFIIVLLISLFLVTQNSIFIAFAAIDYFIRAAFNNKFSPVRFVAIKIIDLTLLDKKPINLAPKIFASRLGFICAIASLILFSTHYITGSIIIAGLLLGLSIMDSVFNFCVGCMIYNYLVLPFNKMNLK